MRTTAAILLYIPVLAAIFALACVLSVALSPAYAYVICKSFATPKKATDGSDQEAQGNG